ncbi:ABC transporter ATP-binding protein [Gammaproteobacteria bacterium]|nr:ABC transporter ATP-binding protein [Gammaproteobacteria bacterium]
MTSLTVDSLKLCIGDKTLCHNLSFTIRSQESWALLGRNGAGKTTLLHSILGINKPTEGSIAIDSVPLQNYTRHQLAKRVGILFQDETNSLPATVLESVLLGRHPYPKPFFRDCPEDLRSVEDLLKELSLEKIKNRKIGSLSGGEMQRVAIAMLLAQEPDIFLLDEPNNNLDVGYQINVLEALKHKINKKRGSILMATHDINFAARFCEYFILFLSKDEILIGNKQEILSTQNLSKAYDCQISSISAEDKTFFYPT